MKKLIYLVPLIFLSGCAKIVYQTVEKQKVVDMMHKFQEVQNPPDPPYLPKAIQTFKMDAKINKLLSKKCDTLRYIVGALDVNGKQVIFVQLKNKDNTSIFIDYNTIKYAKQADPNSAKGGYCPEPQDCSVEL